MMKPSISRSEWEQFDGIKHGVQCRGCRTWTTCNHGWCWSCDGNMRRVDGILHHMASLGMQAIGGDELRGELFRRFARRFLE